MKKKKLFGGIALGLGGAFCALSFAACAPNVRYQDYLQDYVVNNVEGKKDVVPEYRDGFNILQFTDLHWGTTTQIGNDGYGQTRYLQKVVAEATEHAGEIDLIEITGDTFMLSNAATVSAFIRVMEGFEIPYAVTWGNHDREGKYSPAWLREQFASAEHCLYTEVKNDDLAGTSNYVVNLKQGEEVKWQIFHFDSGASYREGAGDFFLTYEYIEQKQLDWLEAQHLAGVPALAYYHIPQRDMKEHFDNAKAGVTGYSAKFFKLENVGGSKAEATPAVEDVFFANGIKGVFMGHEHMNDLTVQTPNGTVYGYGVKTGTELYHGTIDPAAVVLGEEAFGMEGVLASGERFDLIGASLVTLRAGGAFDLQHLYLNERADGDFIQWVVY